MSTAILSLLLLFLVFLGMWMGRPHVERFMNPPNVEELLVVSPTMANLLSTPTVSEHEQPLQINPLERDQEIQKVAEERDSAEDERRRCPTCPTCEVCKKCPDMSQYIRRDEIPCWNCTL